MVKKKDSTSFPLANFTITLRQYQNSKNENYITCIAWGKIAQNIINKEKDDFITISGKIIPKKTKNEHQSKNNNIAILAQTIEWETQKNSFTMRDLQMPDDVIVEDTNFENIDELINSIGIVSLDDIV